MANLSDMSTGDFEAELQQSVQDHLALIATAAKAAKARIGTSVQAKRAPEPPEPFANMPAPPPPPSSAPRPAVNFDAPEPLDDPAFAEASAFSEADAFAAEPGPSPLPAGAISFDDLAVEGVDDEGIPVWEDPP
ncbi:MAG TPA: hypothetical protein VK702_10090 [Candidatus Acidoferrum sp.]|nr:hypothetical protein [Candidatus Acidoferrum sp.]